MNTANFEHKMAAHCETGTVNGILNHAGMRITEPMVFGISSGIFFAYLKTNKLPFPTFVTRSKPGDIKNQIAKRLGVRFKTLRFSDPRAAQARLDELIARNIPVVVQVDMFYMDYIPSYMKAHFNGHFITIVGRENGGYTVSDCYYPELASLSAASLNKARFARGDLAPRGLLFYPTCVPPAPDMREPVIIGIRKACRNMLKLPVPFIGVKGIRMFAKKVAEWPKLARDTEHLSHEIMMITVILEDRGTGGGGFRFMYATFLQEAAAILQNNALADMSKTIMAIGDKWREISLFVARAGKNRDLDTERFKQLQEMILQRADEEERFFSELSKVVN